MRKKQLTSLLLVATMAVSLCACGEAKDDGADSVVATDGTEAVASGTEAGEETSADRVIYDANLGEFLEAYNAAIAAKNVSERYALMAVAEAKLMEAAVMLPINTKGGLYQLSNAAPHTADFTLWGNDYERYHNVVAVTEKVKAADRKEMNAKWAELRGDDSVYYGDWVKEYLTGKGYTLKDTYTITYNADPVTWDVLSTSLSADSEAIINTYDGLMEYDCEGALQPALAESYEVSDDGLTYTFHLRSGAKWVDSQGREIADVKADDFVAGMQHMMDAKGGLEYLVQGVIVNADEYISGDVTDFAEVGVKAEDDSTLVYTLTEPCSYFTTMLGYGVFAPMCRDYFTQNGGKFGSEWETASGSADYAYGKDKDHIAYCGPYLVTNSTAKNTIVFEANPSYWNADGINIKTLKWVFNDGSDPAKAYNDFKAGTVDICGLSAAVLEKAKSDGLFDDYAYISDTDATSYMAFYNLNRQAFANTNDDTKAVSSQTDEDKTRTNAAMNNVHFRRAISFALDRGAYNAQTQGEELKYNSLRNSYTPGNFVSLSEEVTIKINGEDKTYPAGTFFGQIAQDQIDADGVKMTIWDSSKNDGIGSSDGFDGWYNVDNAKEELATAIDELSAAGVEISAENPIVIDLPYESDSEIYSNRSQAYKKSVEDALDGEVIINLVECKTQDEWLYAGYYTQYGYEANFDIYDLSGWGPDYGDPQTYLGTMLPDYAGYMMRNLGIF